MNLRPLSSADWPLIKSIYEEGLATGMATFETEAPASWEIWDRKYLAPCRWGMAEEGLLQAWIALTPFSKRWVYRGVAEISVYVGKQARGKGFGKALMKKVIDEAPNRGFWTLQSAIFAQNEASIQLHKNLGFREVGIRERIAMRDGHWHDNVLLEYRFG
ncbi:MAG: N-acetyltransferase family protein [Saprospiraceae bacterium]|nr:N-acetyltransferase family protein [Saprospiraceae bacterium]